MTSPLISVAPAISSSYSRAGVVINFVTATGGDVEMLRSIECFYKYALDLVPSSNPVLMFSFVSLSQGSNVYVLLHLAFWLLTYLYLYCQPEVPMSLRDVI